MTADEMVVVGRLANRFEDDSTLVSRGYDPYEIAALALKEFKKYAPKLWRVLYDDSSLSDRQIGDWLYDFLKRAATSGMSLKNFAADELDRIEAARE